MSKQRLASAHTVDVISYTADSATVLWNIGIPRYTPLPRLAAGSLTISPVNFSYG